MNPTPTGRFARTTEGRDLVLTRRFRAPIADVWASINEPERTVDAPVRNRLDLHR